MLYEGKIKINPVHCWSADILCCSPNSLCCLKNMQRDTRPDRRRSDLLTDSAQSIERWPALNISPLHKQPLAQ